eukprot:gene2514-3112_t
MLSIKHDSIPKIHTGSNLAFKIRENLFFFIQALEEIGVPRYYLFQASDLLEKKNLIKVLEALEILADIASEFDKPITQLTEKEEAEVQFTDQQLISTDQLLKTLKVVHIKRQPLNRALFANDAVRNKSGAGTSSGISNPTTISTASRPLSSTVSSTSQIFGSSSNTKSASSLSVSTANTSNRVSRPPLSPGQILQKAKPFEKKWIRVQALFRGHQVRREYKRRVRNAAYRYNIVKELLSTEEIYIQNLQRLLDFYFHPMKEEASKLNIKSEHFILLISNIEVILNYNKNLLETIKPKVSNWSFSQTIGDVFQQFTLYLKVYTQYVKEYSTSFEIINNYRKNNSKFESYVTDKEYADQKTIGSYLILPIQRIPRYTLLLNDLVKNTWSDHLDYNNLTEAFKKMQEVASYVNEKKREAENIAKVTEIQNNFIGKFDNLAEPHRRFVFEGNLCVINPNGKESQRIFYLFNDVLIGTKPITSGLVKRKACLKVKESIRMNLVSIRQSQQQQQQQSATQSSTTTESPTATPTTPSIATTGNSAPTPTNNNNKQPNSTPPTTTTTTSTPPVSSSKPPISKPVPPPRAPSTFKTATKPTTEPTQALLRQSAPLPSTTPLVVSGNSSDGRSRTSTNSPSGIAPLSRSRTFTNHSPTTNSTTTNNSNSTGNTPKTSTPKTSSPSPTPISASPSTSQEKLLSSSSISNPPSSSSSTSSYSSSISSSSSSSLDEKPKRQDLIIELTDTFGTCILKLLTTSIKEKEQWISEFKKVQEDLDNRKIVNDEAMKRSQERAGLAKAALSQQYATLRVKGRLYDMASLKNIVSQEDQQDENNSSSPTSSSSPSTTTNNNGERDFSVYRRQTLSRRSQNPTLVSNESPSHTPIGSVSPSTSKEDLMSSSSDSDQHHPSEKKEKKGGTGWFSSLRKKKKHPTIQETFGHLVDTPVITTSSSSPALSNSVSSSSTASPSTSSPTTDSTSSSTVILKQESCEVVVNE